MPLKLKDEIIDGMKQIFFIDNFFYKSGGKIITNRLVVL
jgi:hypothetical protein